MTRPWNGPSNVVFRSRHNRSSTSATSCWPVLSAIAPVALCRHRVIGDGLEAKLRGLAGFRNLLVHDYARVDPERVREALASRLEDLAEFADAVETWLDRQPPESG